MTDASDIVLDPMAGSGTVPAAAITLGRNCYAMDIDPLALMTIRVQCGRHSVELIKEAGGRALTRAQTLRRDAASLDERFRVDFDEETRRFIDRWFPLRVRRGLLALWQAISASTPAARLPLRIAFSRVIIAKTAGSSYAIDLPHTRPHRDSDKLVPDPLQMFPQRLRELVQRLEQRTDTPSRAKLDIKAGDVRHLPYNDGSMDFVLTSSPYANAIDYMRAHKFSLVWMGYSVSELAEIRSRMIGVERGLTEFEPPLRWLEDSLPKVIKRVRPQLAILRRFFRDMDAVVAGIHRVLRANGACVLVLGKTFSGGHVVDTPQIIAEIAERRGFEHIGTVYRDLNPHRRSLPFPRAGGSSPLGNRMAQEAIVALAR